MMSSGNDTGALLRSLGLSSGMRGSGRRRGRQRGGDFLGIGNFFKRTLPNAAKSVYRKVLVPAHDWVKKNKIISRGLDLIPHPAGKVLGTAAGMAGYGRRRKRRVGRGPLLNMARAGVASMRTMAKRLGYGPRKRVVRRRRIRGRGDNDVDAAPTDPRSNYVDAAPPRAWYSSLRGIHRRVKDERLISRGLKKIGLKRIGRVAHRAGYGRKKVVRRKKVAKKRRGGSLASILKQGHALAKKHKVASRLLSHFKYNKLASVARVLGYGAKKRVYRKRR